METIEHELWGATPTPRRPVRRAVISTLAVVRGALGTLKAQLTLAVIAALLLSTGIISALSLAKAERDLKLQAEARELHEATRLAADLSARIVAVQSTLRLTADAIDPALESMDDALEQFINGQPALRNLFSNVFVAEPGGRMRLVIDDVGARRPNVSLADRSYFRDSVTEQRPVVSDPVPGRVSGEPVVVFTHPIVRDGRVTSVIGGAIRVESRHIASALLDREPGEDSGEVLAVTYGPANVLQHPRKALVTRSLAEDVEFVDAVHAWHRQGSPLEPTGVLVNQPGRIVTVAGVAGTGWAVWRSLPEATMLAPIQAVRREVVRDAFIVIGGLSALWVVLIRILLRPLGQLERRATHLFEPDDATSGTWPAERGEVGQVVRALRHVVAERAQLERFSEELLGKLASVMAAAPLGIAFTRQQRFELVSRSWCKLLGREEPELLGAPAAMVFANADDYAALGPFVADAFARDGRYEGEWAFVRKDGAHFWGLLSGQPVDPSEPSAGTIWTLADATSTRDARTSLEWSATHDALTGLLNRKGFERRLEAAVGRAPSVLIAIDLDRFKPINDNYGHGAGDAVLRAVAEAMSGSIRAGDTAVRVGGDEFAVVLEQCPEDAGQRVAENILEAITALRVPWEGQALNVGASLGVAAWSAQLGTTDEWVAAADAACYAAKAAGRGTVHVAEPLVLQMRRAKTAEKTMS